MSNAEPPEDDLARISRMAEIAMDATVWVNQVAHNDYARGQMLRAVHFTLWGEDIGEQVA